MKTLVKRSLVALVIGPVTLAAIWYGSEIFRIFLVFLGGVSALEWLRMVESRTEQRLRYGWFLAVAFFLAVFLVTLLAGLKFGMGIAVASALGLYFYSQMFAGETNIPWLSIGLTYISFSLAMIGLLRETADGALFTTLFLFLVVWASDIGAYVAGKLIGGPKLMPKVSPNKTWAGLIGGMAAAAAVAAGFTWFGIWHGDEWIPLVNRAAIRPVLFSEGVCLVALYGAGMAVVGQIGDLMISKVKRHYGVKDTGTLLPGHGGLLDRIDALLLVGPVFVVGIRFLLKIRFGL